MTTKSVIEIEILDAQFKAFDVQLKAVQSILAQMPAQWKQIAKEVSNEEFAEKKLSAESDRANKKKLADEKNLNKVFEDRKKFFLDAAYFTANIAKNLASGAVSIAKWTALGALGGGFGLAGLAGSASDYRRSAQGLGTSTGGLRAAETNLSNYVDVRGMLSNIASLQHDITQSYKYTRLGGKATGDPLDTLQTVMTNAIKEFKAHGQDINYANAVGLTSVLTPEELIRLSSLNASELQKSFIQLRKDRDSMAVSDANSRAWQEFWNQIGRAGNKLETSFIKFLTALTPVLIDFSDKVTNMVTTLLASDEAKDAIKNFVNYLTGEEFKAGVGDFLDALKTLGKATLDVAEFFGLYKPKSEWENTNAPIQGINKNEYVAGLPSNRKLEEEYLTAIEKEQKLPQGWMDKLWLAESSRGVNMHSPKGAEGHFGMMPATSKAYKVDPMNFMGAGEATGKMMHDLLNMFRGNRAEALMAYNWGSGNVEHYLRGDKGYTNKQGKYVQTSNIPKETVDYLHKFNVNLNVTNNTDTYLSIQALANPI